MSHRITVLGRLASPCLVVTGVLLWSGVAWAAAPTITSEVASNVAATSATLGAEVNPEGSDARYHFEYDTTAYGASAPHGVSLPIPDGEAGEGTTDVAVSVHIQNLRPDTAYHFRVVVTNGEGFEEDGRDETFTTQRAGGEFALPDGRAWEMVSPPNKNGALIEPIKEGVVQAAEGGNALVYLARSAIGTNPAGNAQLAQVLSQRTGSGWSSRDISTPHNAVTGRSIGQGQEYRIFSSDLSLGLVQPIGNTPLPPLFNQTEQTIYRSSECPIHAASEAPATCYEPLVTADNVPPGTKLYGPEQGESIKFVGATADLSSVVASSSIALTPDAVRSQNRRSLYEWTEGQLRLVSVLPNGRPATAPIPGEPEVSFTSFLGDADLDVRHAVSTAGSRIIWGAEGVGTGAHLYMRDMARGETIQLDVAQAGVPEPERGDAQFQTANESASSVFFTDTQRLTADSGAERGKPDLYLFHVISGDGPLAGVLTDLTKRTTEGESASVRGVALGASGDGSTIYFVANGVLAPGATPGRCAGEGEAAPPGATCNLYLWRNGAMRLVATLSSEDGPDWEAHAETNNLGYVTAQVSSSGEYLAFMSQQSLTGYDNTDVRSGQRDEEVFLYNAGSDRLICASCNPTGAGPEGMLDPNTGPILADEGEVWRGHWLAGSIPGWTREQLDRALYQSRYLINSGRLFFDSNDALVAQDVNGKEDVYEYEPPGVGGCQRSSATFSERSDGCVDLISSGMSGEESAFLDASGSGDDVFFLTASRLVPQDVDTAIDVYDAHVCSAAAPCVTASTSSPPCTTADSCRAAPLPEPSVFGVPASAIFSGSGNLIPRTTSAAKPLTGAQKRAKALAACRKRPRKMRAACRRQVRKKYPAAHKAKKTNRRKN